MRLLTGPCGTMILDYVLNKNFKNFISFSVLYVPCVNMHCVLCVTFTIPLCVECAIHVLCVYCKCAKYVCV